MGIDNAHIYNHTMYYTTGDELMSQLAARSGLPVVNAIMDGDCNYIQQTPDDFIGFVVNTDMSLTLQDYIETKELLQFQNQIAKRWEGSFYINPYVMENSLPDCYLGRWNQTAEMCRLIRQYGWRTFEEYEADDLHHKQGVGGGAYLLEDRRKIPGAISKFGSTQLLTFCDDYHDEYLDYISENWTFDDFISWGKKELIFVQFKDLPLFDFPEKKPDYYNVMIWDDFSDLPAGPG